MAIPSLDELMSMEVSTGYGEPVPVGFYNAVITGCEVRSGKKAPYLSVETTIHDEDHKGRKVWRNASFSEKALGMPGGIAELIQATKPDVPRDTGADELPTVIAAAVISTPVRIEVEHEQIKRNGEYQFNADGSPEMRASVRSFEAAEGDFIETIEKEAAGLDDDLPF